MKSRLTAFFAALVMLTGTAQARMYHSEFGFSASLSDNWIILSRQSVSENPEQPGLEDDDTSGFDESMLTRIRQMVESGRFEFLYYRHSDDDFPDNVNLFVSSAEPSDLALGLDPLCAGLKSSLQEAFKRTEFTEVYYCQQGEDPLIEMLVYAFDGAVIGTRSFGYVFNTSAGTVTMTLTCKLAKCDRVKADAEKLFLEMEI
jgi:hypothetical protein